jgi:hypothetical protein
MLLNDADIEKAVLPFLRTVFDAVGLGAGFGTEILTLESPPAKVKAVPVLYHKRHWTKAW